MGLRDVLSHSSKKGGQGEGSHLQQSHQSAALPVVGQPKKFHPIYDEFTGRKTLDTPPTATTGTPTYTTGNAPHFSNTTNLISADSRKYLSQSSKQGHPTTTGLCPRNPTDEASTASIKSGVAGLPQDKHNHTAHDQAQTSDSQPIPGAQQMHAAFAEDVRDATAESNLGRTDGREALAGAAAALAATGTPSHQETQAERHFGTESFNIKSHGEALAAARTAYSGPSTDRTVDPCVTEGDSGSAPFTSGPHCTDTANRLDPKLHIPGGFPETPIETPGERGMDTGSYLPGAHRMSNQPGDPLSSQKEATAMPTNPYTSQKIDPRVDSKPSGPQAASTAPFHESELQPGLAQHTSRNQVDHLQENHPHYGPDAGLIGAGAVATGGLHYASQRDPSKPMTATTAQNPTVSSNAQPAQQRQVSGHEVGITRTDKSDVDQIVDKYMEHSISQTHASLDEQRYDPSAQGAHDASYPSHHHHDGDVAIAAGATGAGHDGKRTEHFPPEQSTVHPVQRIGADHDADHHHDRNTALGAVGVGAAGAGLYAASRKPGYDAEQTAPYGRSDQVAMQQQAAPQPIQQHTHQHFYQQSPHPPLPNQTLEQQPYPQRSLYQPSQPPVQQNPINQSSNQQGGNAAFHAAGAGAASTDLYTPPRPSTEKSDLHRRHDSVQYPNEQYQQKGAGEQQQQHYDGRNAALAGGAAAGVAGASAGDAYEQQQQWEVEAQAQVQAEKERLAREKAEQKELEHQRKTEQKHMKEEAKAAEKKQKAEQKAYERELEHERKQADRRLKEEHKAFVAQQQAQEKERAREQREHDRLLAAEEREREETEHATTAEKQPEPKEKKHHLFGFLHKDKKDKDTITPEQSPRASKEYAAAAQDGSTSPTGSMEKHRVAQGPDGRHKLHKDPPKGHPVWQAMEEQRRSLEEKGDDVRHPMQVAGDETLHSGVYEAPRNPNPDYMGTETQVRWGDAQVHGNGSAAQGHGQLPGF